MDDGGLAFESGEPLGGLGDGGRPLGKDASQNRYAVLYRIENAKRADTRARRIGAGREWSVGVC
jgi:hypothetical protein